MVLPVYALVACSTFASGSSVSRIMVHLAVYSPLHSFARQIKILHAPRNFKQRITNTQPHPSNQAQTPQIIPEFLLQNVTVLFRIKSFPTRSRRFPELLYLLNRDFPEGREGLTITMAEQ